MKYELTMKDKALIALRTQTKLAENKIRHIMETLDDVSVIFSDEHNIMNNKFDKNIISEISKINMDLVESFLKNLYKKGIEVFTYLSSIYPYRLKEISSPPLVLYAKGDLGLLSFENTIAIVGTRRCTNYGDEITKSFSRVLAKNNICIISGLADGIDSIAHQTTLESKGKTIAVMGSGFDNIYPPSNKGLAEKIISTGGLILTEYLPNEKPLSYHFPERNRIVAGLSKAVLIIEAPKRSGALITKEHALENNREIFVVPGRINDMYSFGSNDIIKSCQGTMVLSVDDILEYFSLTNGVSNNKVNLQLSIEEELVYNTLMVNDLHYESILETTGLSANSLNTVLIGLELKNIVKKLPGNIYTSVKI